MTDRRKEYTGRLSFATDAWTSPNHKALMAITVHLEEEGIAKVLLLDVVEVAESHTGLALAQAFKKVLDEFCITNKVRIIASLGMYSQINRCWA